MTPDEIKKAMPDAVQMPDTDLWFIKTNAEPNIGRPVHRSVLEDLINALDFVKMLSCADEPDDPTLHCCDAAAFLNGKTPQ